MTITQAIRDSARALVAGQLQGSVRDRLTPAVRAYLRRTRASRMGRLRAVLVGMADVFELQPEPRTEPLCRELRHRPSDADCLASDWERIGADFHRAVAESLSGKGEDHDTQEGPEAAGRSGQAELSGGL